MYMCDLVIEQALSSTIITMKFNPVSVKKLWHWLFGTPFKPCPRQ